LDNQKFIELLSESKDKAFAFIVEEYAQKVYQSCYYQLGQREDAEDLTQETFVSIYNALDRFEGRAKLSTWIYSITQNKCREHIRNKSRKKRQGHLTVLENEDSHFVPSGIINNDHPEQLLEDKEQAKILFDAIDQLAENQRRAYILSKIEGYSYQEIAELMETSVSSVESLLFRGKKRLKELLSDYYKKNMQ